MDTKHAFKELFVVLISFLFFLFYVHRRTCSTRTSINHVFYISSSEFIVGSFTGLKKRSCHRFHHTDKVTFITFPFCSIYWPRNSQRGHITRQNRYHYFCLITFPFFLFFSHSNNNNNHYNYYS